MKFYVVEKNRFSNEIFAYISEVDNECFNDQFCQQCNKPISPRRWKEPCKLEFSRENIGDVSFGIYSDFVCSQKFRDTCEKNSINGIIRFKQVLVNRIGKIKNSLKLDQKYYVSDIVVSRTRINEEESGFIWKSEPTCDFCRIDGVIKEWNGIYIQEDTWAGEDIFYAIGTPATIIVTERFKSIVEEANLTNFTFIPAETFQPKWM